LSVIIGNHGCFEGFVVFGILQCTNDGLGSEAMTDSIDLFPDKINHLKQKFARSNYQSTSEWAEAVIAEIDLVLIPGIPANKTLEVPELDDELRDNLRQASRQWKADCQVTLTIMHANELLEYELKQGELLEARIARKIKSLFELKTMEQMLAQT
jgi:hypothetical protein